MSKQQILATLQVMKFSEKKMVQEVINLAKIDSFSLNKEGLEKMFAALEKRVKTLHPDHIERIALKNGPALLARKRPRAKRKVYLGGHLDTVFPHPWKPFEKKGILYGPGVSDMKGGLVILLESVRAFEKMEGSAHLGWEILLNPDEELGSPYSTPLIERCARRCSVALLFEPALPNGKLVSARKGSAHYRCIAKGVATHVGRTPDKGVCAITKLAHFICALKKLNTPTCRFFVGKIEGGEAANVTAKEAQCTLNIRFARSFPQKKLAALAKRWGVQLSSFHLRPPKRFDKKSAALFEEVRRCAAYFGERCAWEATGGVCDGNQTESVGVPTIDTLGAEGGKIHTEEEFLTTASLVKKARWTTLLLHRLAQGEIKGCL